MNGTKILTNVILMSLLTLFFACSSVDTADDRSGGFGSLALNLNATGPSGTQYRLANATFTATDDSGNVTSIAGDPPVVVVTLAAGFYVVHLSDGWVIQKQTGGVWQQVPATLLTRDSSVEVIENRRASVTFQFVVGGEVVTTGQGELELQTSVTEDPEGCVVDKTYSRDGVNAVVSRDDSSGFDTITLQARLDASATAPFDYLTVVLYNGYGLFTDGLKAGTYALTGNETGYWTCSACVMVYGDASGPLVDPAELYMATGGSLVLRSVSGRLEGELQGITLEHRYVGTGGVDIDAPDQCITAVTSAEFDAALPTANASLAPAKVSASNASDRAPN